MSDPVHELAHDHGEINGRVLALGKQLAQAVPGDLNTPLTELRDLLFLHFAREEEGLFPFVADAVPDLAGIVRQMEIAHDTICGTLARMVHLAATQGTVPTIAALFERFQVLYSEHSTTEASLLSSLDKRLDRSQRDQLASLVSGL